MIFVSIIDKEYLRISQSVVQNTDALKRKKSEITGFGSKLSERAVYFFASILD